MSKTKERVCQPCTACCDGWVSMNINGVEVYPGKSCPHSTGKGCDDYENRPADPCDLFDCAWKMENSPLPDWMKPSNAKVLVVLDKLQWQGMAVDLAVPVGKKIPPRALNWLKQFAEKQGRPLIYAEQTVENGAFSRNQNLVGYGPVEFQQEVVQWVQSGKRLW
ncbi:MAG: hypothetical protein V3U78_01405 [Thiotrichaceae bacterium]